MNRRICACLLLCAVIAACRTAPPERVVDCRRQLQQALRGAPFGVFRLEYHPDVLASTTSVEFALYPNTPARSSICSYGVPTFSGTLAGRSDATGVMADLHNCSVMAQHQLDRRQLMCTPFFAEPADVMLDRWNREGALQIVGARP